MVFSCYALLTTLFLAVNVRLGLAQCSGNISLDLEPGEEAVYTCSGYGATHFVYSTTDGLDPAVYSVALFANDGDELLHGSIYSEELRESVSVAISGGVGVTRDYQVLFQCVDLASFYSCDGGNFIYNIVQCSCPPETPFQVSPCVVSDALNSVSAVCVDRSTEDIVGSWSFLGSGPSASVSVEESFTTTSTTTYETTVETEVSTAISAGFSFQGVGSAGIEVTSSESSKVSESVATSVSYSASSSFDATCTGDTSTGLYTVWQWSMVQASTDIGAGFSLNSKNFICTESAAVVPRCPAGYCGDVNCQTCLEPFEDLSAVDPDDLELTSFEFSSTFSGVTEELDDIQTLGAETGCEEYAMTSTGSSYASCELTSQELVSSTSTRTRRRLQTVDGLRLTFSVTIAATATVANDELADLLVSSIESDSGSGFVESIQEAVDTVNDGSTENVFDDATLGDDVAVVTEDSEESCEFYQIFCWLWKFLSSLFWFL